MKHIPNLLTLMRLFLAGGAAFVLQSPMPYKYQWFAILILIAGITDAIDGPIARKLGVASVWGGRFDHGVDAAFVGVLLAGMFQLLNREACITLVMLQALTATIAIIQVASKAEEVWPNEHGKWSVIAMVIAIILLGLFKGTRWEAITSGAAYVFIAIAIWRRLQSFWSHWEWLQDHDFLWEEESKKVKQVGKDPA